MKANKVAIIAAFGLLAGCSLAPTYHKPEIATPSVYRYAPGWTAATPLDQEPRGPWWVVFNDPVLADLEARVERASPDLAAALARYDQARAAARESDADLFPTIGASSSAGRARFSANRPLSRGLSDTHNDFVVGGSLSYEFDLWGQVRNSVRAAHADTQASRGDLESARLSLQAQVADAYFRLRGFDAEADLLRQTVEAYGKAYDLTSKRHSGGIASGLDVNRAHAQLASARAEISQIAQQRAAVEHEIAALVGEVASSFTIPTAVQSLEPPALPAAGAPSDLLQRRPDIAAAERRIYAANARIGVARAAFFPSINLGLGGGYETTGGNLLTAASSYWALGPAAAALTIFDAGRRAARVKISRAEYDEAAAQYRSTALTAFRQVEDGFSAARNLKTEAADQREATAAAERTRDLALIRYRDGASDYLEVVIAQTAALDAARSLIALQTTRMQSSIALVRALGGDYPATAHQPVKGSSAP